MAAAPVAILVPDNVGTPVAAAVPLNNNDSTVPLPNLAKKPLLGRKWKVGLGAGLALALLGLTLLLVLRPWHRRPDPLPSAEKTTEADLKRLKERLDDYTDTDAVRRYLLDVQRLKRGEPVAIQAASLVEFLPSPMDGRSPKIAESDRAAAGPIEGLLTVYGDPRLRHWGTSGPRIRALDLSPDGKLVATAGDDGIVRLWNASNGQPQLCLANGGMALGVAFGLDGKRVACMGGFSALKVWDLPEGKVQPAPQGGLLGISPDRRLAAMKTADKPNQIKLWQLARGLEQTTFSEHTKDVYCITFTADGLLAASSGMDQTILIWETATGRLRHTLRGHQSEVHRLQFSNDGRWLAGYEARTETLKLWQVNPERDRATFEKQRPLWAMSPDGRTLIVRGPDPFQMKLFDTISSTEKATLRHRDTPISALAFSPDGRLLATAAAGSSEALKLWDIPAGTEHTMVKGQAGQVGLLKFTADGKTLVTANSEGVVKVWDVDSGEERRSTSNGSDWYTTAAFSRDGKTLALAARGTVRLVDTTTGKERTALPAHNGEINALTFSPDDQTLATAGADGNARLWDVASGQVQATLRHGPGYSVNSVGFTPDGATVITGEPFSVRFWQTSNGVSRGVWQPPKETTFSWSALAPDGKTVAVFSDASGAILFWDVEAGKERPPPLSLFKERTSGMVYSLDQKFLVGRSGGTGHLKLWDLAGKKERATLPPCLLWDLAPDSQTITTYSEDRQLRTWDANTGELRATLEGHAGQVTSLTYSADGQKLATAGTDGRVILWEPLSRKRKVGEAQLAGPVVRVVLAPDGRHVATVNGNGTVYLLRLGTPPGKGGS